MSLLFVSRNNVHARYYRKLIAELGLPAKQHIMGKPVLASLRYLARAFGVDLTEIIDSQIKRKQAKGGIWQNGLLCKIYGVLLGSVEKLRLAKYLALLQQEKPDTLVIWNGKKLPNETVVVAARMLEIPLYFYENGLIPGTTSLDPNGVNFAASLPRDAEFYLRDELAGLPPFQAPEIQVRANHKKRDDFNQTALPERYIFVPFQVPHDTQVVCYSPWLGSMEALYRATVDAVKALGDPDLKLVFKEHPSWHKHYPALYEADEVAIFANGNNTAELIRGAEAVITLNSSVGLEALQSGQRVITLGQACYNIDGLVLHADNESQLVDVLRRLNNGWQTDAQLRARFFSYLQHIYCVPGKWQDCTSEHVAGVKARLLKQDAFAGHTQGNQS